MIFWLVRWTHQRRPRTIFRIFILTKARWTPQIKSREIRMRLRGRNIHGRAGTVVEEGTQRIEAAVLDGIREAIWVGVNGGTKSYRPMLPYPLTNEVEIG